jgi:hypothetical protein
MKGPDMKLITALLMFTLSGCALSPQRISTMNDRQLCNWYGDWREELTRKHQMPQLRAEIDRRALVKPGEWELIDKKEVAIGMSVCAVRASWGSAKENATTTSLGSSIQHVYRLSWCHRCNVKYVYTNNGIVYAIQD